MCVAGPVLLPVGSPICAYLPPSALLGLPLRCLALLEAQAAWVNAGTEEGARFLYTMSLPYAECIGISLFET